MGKNICEHVDKKIIMINMKMKKINGVKEKVILYIHHKITINVLLSLSVEIIYALIFCCIKISCVKNIITLKTRKQLRATFPKSKSMN